MQPQDQLPRIADALNHPDAATWMAFLYAEVAPPRQRELEAHLAHCPECAARIAHWRATMNTLDDWSLPALRRAQRMSRPATREWWPALRWAAAAAVVLVLGFSLGRRTAPGAAELTALKATVAQLTETIQQEQGRSQTNALALATTAATAETLRLLSDYFGAQARDRAVDQQAVSLALQDFERRLGRLRAELETVAVNTENGFEFTHENLARLALQPMPAGSITTPIQ